MPQNEEEIEIFYRFCGNHDPHEAHMFYREFGILEGGKYYDCLGWMTWQL